MQMVGGYQLVRLRAAWVGSTSPAGTLVALKLIRFTVADGGHALRVCEEAFCLVTHGAPAPHSVSTLREFWFDAPVSGVTRVGIVADAS